MPNDNRRHGSHRNLPMKSNDFSMTFPTTNSLIRNSMNDHKKATKCPVSLTVFPSQFKFDGNFVSLSLQWSLQNFVHGTTAVLSSWSWHAQKFVAIWWPATELHGWPSTQPGTCTQPCLIVHTVVLPLFTQPCPGRTMSTAVCIYVARLCASCPAV